MRLFLVTMIIFCLSFNLNANNVKKQPYIEVITSDEFPVVGIQDLKKQGIEVKLYNFDDGKRMIAKLEAGLPNNEAAAKKAMQQRIKSMGNESLKKLFTEAYQAVIIGTQHGITRYPAIVFEQGKSVIYGVTDIPHALALYHQWKAKQ
jgi:integrating conjugative element protein (TIGR03757 family)